MVEGLKKTKKHYDIQIDGNNFKIMNYILSKGPKKTLRLITKIRGQKFPQKSVAEIEITTVAGKITVQGRFIGVVSSPILEEWMYEIE